MSESRKGYVMAANTKAGNTRGRQERKLSKKQKKKTDWDTGCRASAASDSGHRRLGTWKAG